MQHDEQKKKQQATLRPSATAHPAAGQPSPSLGVAKSSHPSIGALFTAARITSDPTDIRITNQMAIFSMLFPNVSASRAQISRHVHLSRVSVSQAVSNLIDRHLLTESGPEQAGRPGKRGMLIRLDLSYWRIITIDLSALYLIRGAVVDIAGDVFSRVEQPIIDPRQITPQMVEDMCRQLLQRANGHILGIGVACTGIIDKEGTVVTSTNLGWSHVPLRQMLQKRFGYPCSVDHDSNSATLGVRFFDDPTPNMIYVQISRGIGAGILLDDHLVLGPGYAAGEIGHVIVDPNGPLCTCGRHGCLESFISANRLRAQVINHPDRQRQILQQAGKLLGGALASSASLLDIDHITVSGPADLINTDFIDGAEKQINITSSASLLAHRITVRRCEVGQDVVVLGEAMAVLQKQLERKS